MYNLYKQNSIKHKIKLYEDEISNIKSSLNIKYSQILTNNQNNLQLLKQNSSLIQKNILNKFDSVLANILQSFEALKPGKQMKDSFAQITKDGKTLSVKKIKPGSNFTLETAELKIGAKALEVIKI